MTDRINKRPEDASTKPEEVNPDGEESLPGRRVNRDIKGIKKRITRVTRGNSEPALHEENVEKKGKTFSLPEKEEMSVRLSAMHDEQGLPEPFRKRFYPLLLEHAGTKCTKNEIIQLFLNASLEYGRTLPKFALKDAVLKYVPFLIEAIVDDLPIGTADKWWDSIANKYCK